MAEHSGCRATSRVCGVLVGVGASSLEPCIPRRHCGWMCVNRCIAGKAQKAKGSRQHHPESCMLDPAPTKCACRCSATGNACQQSPCRLHQRDTHAGLLTWRSRSRLLGGESLDAFKQLQGRAGVADALLVDVHHLCLVLLGGVVGVGGSSQKGSSSRAAVSRAAVSRVQQAVSWPYRRIPNTTASAELFSLALDKAKCTHTHAHAHAPAQTQAQAPRFPHTPVLASKGCPHHWGFCRAAAAGRPAGRHGAAQGVIISAKGAAARQAH